MRASFIPAATLISISFIASVNGVSLVVQSLMEKGTTTIHGQPVKFVIRRLPVSSFPTLPEAVASELMERGCMIPQTYEAHRPENVVHASLAHKGSSDWAVLCSVNGTVSLLVFLNGMYEHPTLLASALETTRLQPHDPSGVLGFNWGIDRVTPRQMHDVVAGLEHRPPAIDHDVLADSAIEEHTVYHLYANGAWSLVEVPN